jgi:hypothetical protein
LIRKKQTDVQIQSDKQSEKIKIDLYNKLMLKIKQRIIDIEEFYEYNIHDSKVCHFEKIRIKLKKILTYKPEILNQIENNKIERRQLR